MMKTCIPLVLRKTLLPGLTSSGLYQPSTFAFTSRCIASRSAIPALAQEKKKESVDKKEKQYLMPHPIWEDFHYKGVKPNHRPPKGIVDWLAYSTIQIMRFNFDVLTGYKFRPVTSESLLTRIIFLESVAGVPGSVAAVIRHLHSLRRMRRDHGWIHTLLEEAENERMHLMCFLEMKQPGKLFRLFVILAQGVYFNFFFVSYLFSPRFCHRMVGYLEEEAVKTYTQVIHKVEEGPIPEWSKTPAPEIGRKYWMMKENASVLDMVYLVRADEDHHRLVNHGFADLKEDEDNPF
eukprot:TRINITY_DN5893_c0_g1_i1.p1 TRINITY_DN5893_c0_g1~~TRINITY_DN5893_c0_g1_i1.p1  ORF type:complete len:292 (-),score=43.95 TRINITY_DN5893_c0_g1_i1:43-918(-)